MKKLFPILFISLFIFSCDDSPTDPEDVYGCTDSSSCSFDPNVNIYVPGSCLELDECGECGGDNSTCSDECGIPNGDNSTCTDECGIVNGPGVDCVGSCNQENVEIWNQCYNIETTTTLDLSNNQLTGMIPNNICELPNLRWYSYNFVAGSTLQSSFIGNNQLCPPYPVCIEDYVEQQDLTNCQAPEGYVEIFGQFYSIEQTTELNLFQSGLTGSIPSEIFELINLTYLNLSLNELTGSIPSEIGNLVNLTSLSIYNNQLTGEIPPEIGNIENLEKLYIHNNQLEGSITFIGSLTNLEFLYLYNNQFTGVIPSEIGNLINLNYLKLRNNYFTGVIPMSICDLDILWVGNNYFDINENQFCPPYPFCIENYIGNQDTSNCD